MDLVQKDGKRRRLIRAFCAIALAGRDSGLTDKARVEHIRQGLARLLLDESHAFGCTLSDDQVLSAWKQGLELDAQGLDIWVETGAVGAP